MGWVEFASAQTRFLSLNLKALKEYPCLFASEIALRVTKPANQIPQLKS